jgi:hypothetical protein
MFLTNHTLTGVFLGLKIKRMSVLVPVALASHLAMDMLPHFGVGSRTLFLIIGSADFTISIAIAIAAWFIWPDRRGRIMAGILGADFFDLTYIPAIVFGSALVGRWLPFYAPLESFLAVIQWSQTIPGLITEVVWAAAMTIILSRQCRPTRRINISHLNHPEKQDARRLQS